MNEDIEVGDEVIVNCHNAMSTICHRGSVLKKPVATGDYWLIRDLSNRALHAISEGVTITKPYKVNKSVL